MPYTLSLALGGKQWITRVLLVAILVTHPVCLAGGGRWGQNADVARDLLEYAEKHDGQLFVTDNYTHAVMGAIRGFRVPPNVITLEKARESGSALAEQSAPSVDGILVNLEQLACYGDNTAFCSYLDTYGGARSRISAIRFHPLFIPILPLVGARDFGVRNLGGQVADVLKSEEMPASHELRETR